MAAKSVMQTSEYTCSRRVCFAKRLSLIDLVLLVVFDAFPSRKCSVNGALGKIRTPDPLIRSQVLYPAELRVLTKRTMCIAGRFPSL